MDMIRDAIYGQQLDAMSGCCFPHMGEEYIPAFFVHQGYPVLGGPVTMKI
jgi:hypothetical protein